MSFLFFFFFLSLFSFIQAQLEQMVTKLKVDKAQLEVSLREEEAKCGLLLKEVKESNEVYVRFFACLFFLFGNLHLRLLSKNPDQ